MKNLSFIAALLLLSLTSLAQKPFKSLSIGFEMYQPKTLGDTLMPESFSTGTLTLDTALAGGYVCGNNTYGDLAKAQIFKMPDNLSYNVRGVGLLIGDLVVANPVEELIISIHDTKGEGNFSNPPDTLGAPGYAFSQISVPASLLVNNQLNIIDFNTEIFVNDDYALCMDISGFATNTIGLMSTTDGDAQNSETAMEKVSDGSWYSMLNSWGWDAEIGIFSIINGASAHTNNIIPNEMAIDVFPNPISSENLFLNIQSIDNEMVDIELFDEKGEMIQKFCNNKINVGLNTLSLNFTNLSQGHYFLRINNNKKIYIKKIVVI